MKTLRFGWFLAAITMLLVTSGCDASPTAIDHAVNSSGCHIMCE